MANGQQKGGDNLAAFRAWAQSKSDDDFREYVYRGQLKRSEIFAECGFARSVLAQNPTIKAELEELEAGLRKRGVLPAEGGGSNQMADKPVIRDVQAKQRRQDSQRLNSLEQENASLRAELGKAKSMLERCRLMSEFLDETGRMPR
ncbi:VPA1267 family protein [Pseudomonas juntendi]|uniref:VPA1267 family protein n=1 Tax=Pseudomonas juntendi TaxID=2666183 RepID=UPI001FFC898F|nr:VPA1267 family protein [Pseudomonas juntendi]MCK2111209.1 VPA1267 family protein [Pseudomonas juntendi]